MTKWEYFFSEYDDFNTERIDQDINHYGELGWELIHISASLRTYFFKRPKIEDRGIGEKM